MQSSHGAYGSWRGNNKIERKLVVRKRCCFNVVSRKMVSKSLHLSCFEIDDSGETYSTSVYKLESIKPGNN